MYSTVTLHPFPGSSVYLDALLWDGGAYLKLSSSSAVGETRIDLTRHRTAHPPPEKHPADRLLVRMSLSHAPALFPKAETRYLALLLKKRPANEVAN